MTARPVVTQLNTQEAVVGEPYITVYFSAGVCVCVFIRACMGVFVYM